jgi:uncharacterized membrane protein YuzA (DUF378 family)
MATDDGPGRRRARIRRGLPAVALAIAGAVVLGVAGDSTALNAVAIMLFGIAGVWTVSLVFYEIGLGEDRDRAAARRGGPYDRR